LRRHGSCLCVWWSVLLPRSSRSPGRGCLSASIVLGRRVWCAGGDVNRLLRTDGLFVGSRSVLLARSSGSPVRGCLRASIVLGRRVWCAGGDVNRLLRTDIPGGYTSEGQ